MEPSEGTTDVVHPEVRAHINSLASALGGFSADDDGRYVLGDSALEVLRDIKKWIRFYDEKTNRMDVARCLADANIVSGDLLHILATWPENETDNKFRARAALACFEIMVPLTWPLERDRDQMTVNHHRHLPVLQLAQLGYKRAIINFDAAQILHTAVRIALPSMALSRSDRSGRDEGIIKLVLLFLRNVAMISPPPGVQYDGDESQISRSALIDAFSYQDILLTILTIASNMGEDFNQEGVIIMEIIFHLVKRVDVTKLFMDEKQLGKAKSNELTAMMNKEAAMHRPYNRKAPSRHNRWGTMIWVDRGDGKVSTVTGQDALLDAATRQHKMDNSKVYRPPRRPRKEDMEPKDLGPPVSLNTRAREQLKGFVEEFLDSSFNPLFQHVRKKLDEQKDYIFEYHSRQFFYLVSWFLEAERVRKKIAKDKAKNQKSTSDEDVGSFNLVAGVLNQQTFITLNRAIGDSLESKRWPELCAAMRCFTQILLTVQEMSESGNEEDEEIAENILSRIFYEDETHDRIANIARDYKDQGFEYLDACTDLTHTYLRVLEAYSKQNVDMQVRSRRRVRKKKKAANTAGEDEENPVEGDESENDQANAERVSRERKFDFNRFVNRFTPQGVVDTFVKFTKYYKDLDDTQLKRAHRYFYRIAFKQNMSVMLFRVDIIQLFYSMIKGQEPLDKGCTMYKEWEELVKQILKKCIRKVEERPQLIIEMLFSKINATAHYLEYGYEKQTLSTSQSKPAAELEFRHLVGRDQQIAIAVGVLLDKNLGDHVTWLKGQLSAAETERRAWEAAEKAMPSVEAPPVEGGEKSNENGGEKEGAEESGNASEQQNTESPPPKEPPAISIRMDNDARRTAMFKNSHLRLLMKLVGIERLVPDIDETPESAWIIPPHQTPDQLKESIDLINKAEFNPPTFEDGKLAEDQLRRKTAPRKKAVFDDDEDGIINDDDDDDILFPAGGPTARKVADGNLDKPKKTRRRRRKGSEAPELNEDELEEKERARREREKAKAKRFKSELYVHASDDESDEEEGGKWAEFYANEERIRKRQQQNAVRHGAGGVVTSAAKVEGGEAGKVLVKERVLVGSGSENDDDLVLGGGSDDDSDDDGDGVVKGRGRKRGVGDDNDEDDAMDDTPVSSPRAGEASAKRRRLSKEPSVAVEEGDVDMEDADDDDVPSSKAPPRRRRAGFVVDSSDDEE
ncbi:timeless-domain-containing protein [Annulohypoxylon maeteangense]|uniref:timeless-domain-containing protein n=1 Tax=Annulohypoxylon maeteangense TaxID=1927788 RepID=UPI00200765E4|nr:timeless-domain-containing protein [Annulohypoxylon maeteangense]KAI0881100.1 timeless-domain-containing protein [Annulohypoxylon maeteangense]